MIRPAQLEAVLARDPLWRPTEQEVAPLAAEADRAGAPDVLCQEVRWWRAFRAAERKDWEEASRLAEVGLGEPFSEREAVRIAFLHCLSGDLAAAEHSIAQAVQTASDESLPHRFAAWCRREGLLEAAERFGRV